MGRSRIPTPDARTAEHPAGGGASEAVRGLVRAARKLGTALAPWVGKRDGLVVLSPLEYAWRNHRAYIERHARAGVEAILVGMNPGPWGMGQTGVPFGDPELVRDFLGIRGKIDRPRVEHGRFRALGFESHRREASGQRLWGGVRSCFGTAPAFFERFFVANYCPLLFLNEETGANVPPDELPRELIEPISRACDEHLLEVVGNLRPARVVGVGAWTARTVARVLEGAGDARPRGVILHPSPASPTANRGWLALARKQLADQGCPWPEPTKDRG